MLRRLASLAGLALVLLIVTVACLEVALRLANALEIVTPQRRVTEAPFYQDRDRAFGVWHDPDRDYVPIAECFDVVYSSNSYGARDVERPRRSAAPRVVVLGDSFVEGIGVDREARMTDLLEGQTGIPHLNFGTAGAFSSTQEWKLYETLASDFDHEWLMLFAFPYNDFVENDHERWWERERYRPYLRRTGGGSFELFYPISFEEAQERAEAQLWWNRLYNALFVYRLVAIVDGQLRYRMAEGAAGETGEFGYSGYTDFTEGDLEILFHTYRQIRDLADGRELVVFTIPRLNDLMYAEAGTDVGALPRRLAAFAEAEPGIRYMDLLPGFLEDSAERGRQITEYFLPCDPHWSALGNAVAAELAGSAMRAAYAEGSRPGGAGDS